MIGFEMQSLDLGPSLDRLTRVRAYLDQLTANDPIRVAWLFEHATRTPDVAVSTFTGYVLSPDPSLAREDQLPIHIDYPGVTGGLVADLLVDTGEEPVPREHPSVPTVRGRFVIVVPPDFEVPKPAADQVVNLSAGPVETFFLTPGEEALYHVVQHLASIGRDHMPDSLYPAHLQLMRDAQRLLGRAIAERLVPIVEEEPF